MWVIYALLSAFFASLIDPLAKFALRDGDDEYLVGYLIVFLSTPFLAVLYLSHTISPITPLLLKVIVAVLPFEILATILYYKALKLTDISLSVPFLALTPMFSMLTAFVILREKTTIFGILGIMLITCGVYSLHLKQARYGFINPIKAVIANKGSLYMVLVALIFSITATMSKKAMLCSNPQSIPFIYNTSVSAAILPIIIYRLKTGRFHIGRNNNKLLVYVAAGLSCALSSIFYFNAISLVNVAYAISIKRLSLLMSVGYGWLFFRERDIHIRLFSTFCMFLGVLAIILCK